MRIETKRSSSSQAIAQGANSISFIIFNYTSNSRNILLIKISIIQGKSLQWPRYSILLPSLEESIIISLVFTFQNFFNVFIHVLGNVLLNIHDIICFLHSCLWNKIKSRHSNLFLSFQLSRIFLIRVTVATLTNKSQNIDGLVQWKFMSYSPTSPGRVVQANR